MWCICYNWWTKIDTEWILLWTKFQSSHQGFYFVWHSSVSFDKYILSFIHHYSIIQNNSTALKIPGVPSILSLPYSSSSPCWQLIFYYLYSFTECHVVEIISYVAFSNWLLWLSSMHLSFPLKCLVMVSYDISFYCWITFPYMDV